MPCSIRFERGLIAIAGHKERILGEDTFIIAPNYQSVYIQCGKGCIPNSRISAILLEGAKYWFVDQGLPDLFRQDFHLESGTHPVAKGRQSRTGLLTPDVGHRLRRDINRGPECAA